MNKLNNYCSLKARFYSSIEKEASSYLLDHRIGVDHPLVGLSLFFRFSHLVLI